MRFLKKGRKIPGLTGSESMRTLRTSSQPLLPQTPFCVGQGAGGQVLLFPWLAQAFASASSFHKLSSFRYRGAKASL